MSLITFESREARAKWRKLLDRAGAGGDTVIERYGQPTAALIPFEDFIELQDELDDLRAGRRAQAALAAWQRDPARGRSWADVKAEMIRDGLLDG